MPRADTPMFLPALHWLRNYKPEWLRGDTVAGITLAAYMLPAAIGDASLAGLSPQAGLYACLFSGLVFWLFCSSRQTAITVTSAISLLIGSTLGGIAHGDASRFASLAAATALMVGVIAFIAWLVRAGALVSFISEGVMTGFKGGVALFLLSTQLPKLCGLSGAHGDFWANSAHFLRHLPGTNIFSLIVGAAALSILVLGKMFLKNKPVALVVLVCGIAAAAVFDLEARGVKLLGDVPSGLPGLALPAIGWTDVNLLLPLAFACFLLAAAETAAIGRMFAAKNGGRFNADQEFLALAFANTASAIGQGYPVGGGMSQSLVNESGGARTPLSGLLAAGFILLVVVFFSHLLKTLPQPVVAAIVIVAVSALFNVAALADLWRGDRLEFSVAIISLLGVLGSGLLQGVLIGSVISLVLLIHRTSKPHVAVLGRIPGTQKFSDRERNPENEEIPSVLILRPESSLVYFNIDHVRDTIAERVDAAGSVGLVILDLSASPFLDMQSTHTLAALAGELASRGTKLQVVDARSSVRDRLRREGVDRKLGGIARGATVADAVTAFQRDNANQTTKAASP